MRAPRMTWPLAFGVALAAALLTASPSSAAVTLPDNTTVDKVDFERHLMGLFGRMGCNGGGCHGSFQGKGGFRLSLFGYEPDKDYFALTRDVMGRRINPLDPDRSLLLLKATGQVPHGGGVRFGKDSWQYRLFREWIVSGTPWKPGSGDVARVLITPSEVAFPKAGAAAQLKVLARFKDGSEIDITPFCDFRTNDDAVANVTSLGQITALKPGGTAIVVSYRGNVVPVRVLVPMELPAGFLYPKVPAASYIDREVFARLRKLNMVPSDLADDAEFLRRVTIDTIGSLPSPEEVRAFLADKSLDKRARKIDALLANPLHAALWATKFSDITGNDTVALEQPNQLKAKRSQQWHDWFRKRLAANMPYDELVRGVLCATSRDGKAPEAWLDQARSVEDTLAKGYDTSYADRATLDLFWRRQQKVPLEQWGEKTAAAFMGIRLECAQCHKHPYDRWSQVEYRSYANIFGQVTFGVSPEARKLVTAENVERRKKGKNNQVAQIREVFVARTAQSLPNPDTNQKLTPKALGGPEILIQPGQDARVTLFEWLRQPDNPFFARSFVNRVWGHYFGIGLVHPVDDFSLGNPPSNEKLLDALAKDFVDHHYDIRYIERQILNSRVYQLTSRTNETNKLDRNNYAHSYVRPMMAEVVVDVLDTALGAPEDFKQANKGKLGPDARPGSRAIEVGASTVQNQALAYAFRIFGRPPRTTACDCERGMEPALPQKLYLMTDTGVLAKLKSPAGRLESLLKSSKTDEQILEELFLATLTRYPTEADRRQFADYRKTVTARRAAFTDTLWALINTREFILNH
jgi:Protein of unknown function (DUF1549)/Protein of unknown function (DUF1553)